MRAIKNAKLFALKRLFPLRVSALTCPIHGIGEIVERNWAGSGQEVGRKWAGSGGIGVFAVGVRDGKKEKSQNPWAILQ